jgi:hypothetical protein
LDQKLVFRFFPFLIFFGDSQSDVYFFGDAQSDIYLWRCWIWHIFWRCSIWHIFSGDAESDIFFEDAQCDIYFLEMLNLTYVFWRCSIWQIFFWRCSIWHIFLCWQFATTFSKFHVLCEPRNVCQYPDRWWQFDFEERFLVRWVYHKYPIKIKNKKPLVIKKNICLSSKKIYVWDLLNICVKIKVVSTT